MYCKDEKAQAMYDRVQRQHEAQARNAYMGVNEVIATGMPAEPNRIHLLLESIKEQEYEREISTPILTDAHISTGVVKLDVHRILEEKNEQPKKKPFDWDAFFNDAVAVAATLVYCGAVIFYIATAL